MIEQLQKYCASFPGFSESIKWEHNLCFCVAEKIFAVVSLDDVPTALSFKTTNEIFDKLTERDGFSQAPYFAKNQWVKVADINLLSANEWKTYLNKAYELVKAKLPKKVREELN